MSAALDTIVAPSKTAAGPERTLADLLAARGLEAANIVAIRNTLHADDISNDFRTLADVIDANALPMLDRMQDGPRIAHEALVLSFAALDDGHARLTGFRRFLMRREGIVPTDIVYDYDAAHLLHAFIARAHAPVFYDAFDEDGLSDLIGQLVVQWPQPVEQNIIAADDPGLLIVG
ncbi:hypothetical protein [Afipia birgiae]|jgi:hypothetical protein|uniref:hypothetical protein n=1 Tax=Afipia birgiae TaxID=151414 RepID=UPI0002ECE5CC|nr:hypothetical protein [Afipia birgiae]MBX9822079.1 hypothetical protein [Afipia birgiae]